MIVSCILALMSVLFYSVAQLVPGKSTRWSYSIDCPVTVVAFYSSTTVEDIEFKNVPEQGAKITFYNAREKKLQPFFIQEDNLLFCHNVRGLLGKMGLPEYFPDDWHLFTDSSKQNFKCVLLHNGYKYGSIPIARSTKMKEKCDSIVLVLEKIKYHEYQWQISWKLIM
ncbi:hypothetical protein J437_LFUL005488 [Ladona fulva]|uniref:Uncharacterized protein n=1 Tax=Ladona fulva TaxID=123851 RepID=A0A8K0K1Q7_LADFU|nr:hypothetical protein J437_LFUL005488 [Ladona fulva]